jgi:peptidyl-prolyl cis-trans isomerase C
VATVNGEKIKENDLSRLVDYYKKDYENRYGYSFDGQVGEEKLNALKDDVLGEMIKERLLIQEAKKRGITVSKDQVQKKVDADKAMLGGDQAYKDLLQEQFQMTEAEFRVETENQLIIEELYNQVVAGQQVTPQEVSDYYANNQEQFLTLEQIRASHILLNTEDEAKAVIAQLKAGASFEDLATEKSTDPTAKDNKGDLGYFDQEANLVSEFKEAAFALKTGQITPDPVKSQFGYHVIKVVDRKPARQMTLEEATPSITDELKQDKESTVFQKFLDDLEAGAQVQKEDFAGSGAAAQ